MGHDKYGPFTCHLVIWVRMILTWGPLELIPKLEFEKKHLCLNDIFAILFIIMSITVSTCDIKYPIDKCYPHDEYDK